MFLNPSAILGCTLSTVSKTPIQFNTNDNSLILSFRFDSSYFYYYY